MRKVDEGYVNKGWSILEGTGGDWNLFPPHAPDGSRAVATVATLAQAKEYIDSPEDARPAPDVLKLGADAVERKEVENER